mmetsp:Transcript_21955/g.36326  ORF Transcript_21955/g.36326 Transcript_21955/m.36326 type:complete len:319 (+) Transcript_21955:98-1054(+)
MSWNSLAGVDGALVGDGSEGTVQATSENGLLAPGTLIASETRGSPFNVMFDGSVPTSTIFFEVTIMELTGSIAVGVVKKKEFHQGYKTKGMFYNGNVTNGSAALTVSFGDHVKASDKVGVLIERESSEAVQAVFYLNNICLGPAFRLESIDANEIFYPCIHVTGEATVDYSVPLKLPVTTNRQSSHQQGSYIGDWKLEKLFTGPELHEFPLPEGHDIILIFKGGPANFRFSAKVGNTIGCQIEVEGKQEAFDKIKVGPVMGTKMMPPPALQAVESLINESLPILCKMIISDSSLIMTGATVELNASRYSKMFEPLTKY